MSKELTAQQFADKLEVTRQLIYYHAKKIPAQDKVYNEENKLVFTPDQQEFLMSFMTDTLAKEEAGEEEDLDYSGYEVEEGSDIEWERPEFTYDPELAKQIALVLQNESLAKQKREMLHEDPSSEAAPSQTKASQRIASDKALHRQAGGDQEKVLKSSDPIKESKDQRADKMTNRSNDKLVKSASHDKKQTDKETNDKETNDGDKAPFQNFQVEGESTHGSQHDPEGQASFLRNEAAVLDYIQEAVRDQLQDKWRQDEEERQMLLDELNTKNQQIADLHQLLDQQQQLMLVTEQKHRQLLDLVNQQALQLAHSPFVRGREDWIPNKSWLKHAFKE